MIISRSNTEGDETPVEVEKETNENQPVTNDNEPVNTALTKKDKPKKDPKKANTNANANTGSAEIRIIIRRAITKIRAGKR